MILIQENLFEMKESYFFLCFIIFLFDKNKLSPAHYKINLRLYTVGEEKYLKIRKDED